MCYQSIPSSGVQTRLSQDYWSVILKRIQKYSSNNRLQTKSNWMNERAYIQNNSSHNTITTFFFRKRFNQNEIVWSQGSTYNLITITPITLHRPVSICTKHLSISRSRLSSDRFLTGRWEAYIRHAVAGVGQEKTFGGTGRQDDQYFHLSIYYFLIFWSFKMSRKKSSRILQTYT